MALIGPVKRNGGGSGKRIKRDTGTRCNFTCSCLCVCKVLYREVPWISWHQDNSLGPSRYTKSKLCWHTLSLSHFPFLSFVQHWGPSVKSITHQHNITRNTSSDKDMMSHCTALSRSLSLSQVSTVMVSEMVVTSSVCVIMPFPATAAWHQIPLFETGSQKKLQTWRMMHVNINKHQCGGIKA